MVPNFDLVIIGGGINGCGIAADAALRGLKTLLIEKDDLASKTSSSSSKLIHGGLRYLEHYEFSLVKRALTERQILLQIAPHLVHPLPLVLPYKKHMRPTWLLRIGLFLYDHLSRKNKLPNSQFIQRISSHKLFAPLLFNYQKGFLFYDCVTDDARLTIANALQARQYGAQIWTHTELIAGKSSDNQWELTIQSGQKKPSVVTAKVVINTTGPWVESVNDRLGVTNQYHISLIKGSHIVIPKLYEGNQAYFLQNEDKRVVFVLPYHNETMVGTTEIKLDEPIENPRISEQEMNYLLNSLKEYFKKHNKPEDILSSWSGIRPLIEQAHETPQELSRDYTLNFSTRPAHSLVVYGGKITTYRQLAEEAINLLKPVFPHLAASQTAKTALPGSQPADKASFSDYVRQLSAKYSWLDQSIKTRLLNTYGSHLEMILAKCAKTSDLGQHFGNGLYQVEIDYLIEHEWAITSDDILWRRTKLGLQFNADETKKLGDYLSHKIALSTQF